MIVKLQFVYLPDGEYLCRKCCKYSVPDALSRNCRTDAKLFVSTQNRLNCFAISMCSWNLDSMDRARGSWYWPMHDLPIGQYLHFDFRRTKRKLNRTNFPSMNRTKIIMTKYVYRTVRSCDANQRWRVSQKASFWENLHAKIQLSPRLWIVLEFFFSILREQIELNQ